MASLQTYRFNGDILEVVENGASYIGVKSFCKSIGIDFNKQHRKLKSDESFEARLLKVQTQGGIQEVFCIPLEKLNGWLFTINPNKVRPEVREKLIAYKKECFKVLYEHFIAKAERAQSLPAKCQSEIITPQIMGYKGNLAKQKKKIEELRWENVGLRGRIQELEEQLKEVQANFYNATFCDHQILDLAGSLQKEVQVTEEIIATMQNAMEMLCNRKQRTKSYIDSIVKAYPKTGKIVKLAENQIKEESWIPDKTNH